MRFKKSLFLAVIGISTLSSITFPAGLPISADLAELKETEVQVGDVYHITIEGEDRPIFRQITRIDWLRDRIYFTQTIGIPFGTDKIDHSTGRSSMHNYKRYDHRKAVLRNFIDYLNDGLKKKNIVLVEDPEVIQQYNDLEAIAAIRLKYRKQLEEFPRRFDGLLYSRCDNGRLSRYANGAMDPRFISFFYYDLPNARSEAWNNERLLEKLPRDAAGEIDRAFLTFCYKHRDTIELFGWSLSEKEQGELEGKLNSIMSRSLIFAWEELRKQKIRNNSSLGKLPIEIVALIAGKDPSSAKTQNGKEEEGSDFSSGDPSAAAAAAAVPHSRYLKRQRR